MVGKLILNLECDDRSSVRRLEGDEDLEELREVPVDGCQVRVIGTAETHVWITKKPTEGRRERGERECLSNYSLLSMSTKSESYLCWTMSSKIKKKCWTILSVAK